MPTEPIGREDFAAMVDALKDTLGETVKAAVAEAANGPLLLDAKQAREFLGVGRTAWFALRSTGKLPAPVDAGGLKWKRSDLEEYVARLKPARRRRSD